MAMRPLRLGFLWAILGCLVALAAAADRLASIAAPSGWRQHDVQRPRPPVVEPPPAAASAAPPADAVVLFDGKSLEAWQTPEGGPAGWAVKSGFFEVTPGAGPIQTKATFGDVQLHVEWAAPDPPAGLGQDRGNSGVFLMGQFEIQVLDSYRAETYADGQAGAIYGQYPPLFNAARPPGQWQTYEIAFRRPRFDPAGKLVSPARITVFLNGILVQDNEELWGQTSWLEPLPFEPALSRGPIQLQDHGHPVRFRNIWVREIPDRPGPGAGQADRPRTVVLAQKQLEAVAGDYEAGVEPKVFRLKISREGDHLWLSLPFRPTPLRLLPISETTFILPHTDGRFTFTRGPDGRAVGCEFQVGDGSRTLRRASP